MSPGFPTTHWSLLRSEKSGGDSAASRAALEYLAGAYWEPLYAYLRRRGYSESDAADLIQSFFVRLLDGEFLAKADPERGRFRTFVIVSLKHFVANEHARAAAHKRSPGTPLIPLEPAHAEQRMRIEPVDDLTPDALFERRWAQTVMQRALLRLRTEQERIGQGERFSALSDHVIGDGGARYDEVADRLGLSVANVKVTVHRLRKRLGECLRAEIASTVASADMIDAELRYLLERIRAPR